MREGPGIRDHGEHLLWDPSPEPTGQAGPALALRSSAAMCVDPYLLPEHQSCSQDAQDTQEADEAKEQELLGGPWGLPVACV